MLRFSLLLLLAGCGGDEGGSDPAPAAGEDAPLPQMAPERLLARASLDLRGVRPSPAELDRLAADPAVLDTILEEKTVRDLIPKLKAAGGQGIVEYPLNKIVV